MFVSTSSGADVTSCPPLLYRWKYVLLRQDDLQNSHLPQHNWVTNEESVLQFAFFLSSTKCFQINFKVMALQICMTPFFISQLNLRRKWSRHVQEEELRLWSARGEVSDGADNFSYHSQSLIYVLFQWAYLRYKRIKGKEVDGRLFSSI